MNILADLSYSYSLQAIKTQPVLTNSIGIITNCDQQHHYEMASISMSSMSMALKWMENNTSNGKQNTKDTNSEFESVYN